MDIFDLTHLILLLDCGSPVIEERRSSEMDARVGITLQGGQERNYRRESQ
jgi:hypothetical protein